MFLFFFMAVKTSLFAVLAVYGCGLYTLFKTWLYSYVIITDMCFTLISKSSIQENAKQEALWKKVEAANSVKLLLLWLFYITSYEYL